jgi:hypothetical protein
LTTDHNFMESGRLIVRFALATAATEGGSPHVIAIDQIHLLSMEAAAKTVATGAVVECDRSVVASWIKGEMFKATFIAFDEIFEGDGWKEIILPWAMWTAEIEELVKTATDRVVLDIAGRANDRIANRAGKHLSLLVQRRAADLLRGYPIPRIGRVAIVNGLFDVAAEEFDQRLVELGASFTLEVGGRAQ